MLLYVHLYFQNVSSCFVVEKKLQNSRVLPLKLLELWNKPKSLLKMYQYPDFDSVSGCVCEQPPVGNLLPGRLLPTRLAGKVIEVLPTLGKIFRLFHKAYD